MKRYCSININEKFLEIFTCSDGGYIQDDPVGYDLYFDPLVDIDLLGMSLLRVLSKSRDFGVSEEDRRALMEGEVSYQYIEEKYPKASIFSPVACDERHRKWVKRTMKKYGYLTKRAFYKNMQSINIDDDGERITFVSLRHLDIDSWSESSEKNPVIKFSISLSNRVEVIGAAVRYAIGSCKGLGAYYIKDLLFPNGFPISFEEYLEQLELSLL